METKPNWKKIDLNGQTALIIGAIIYSVLIGTIGNEEFYFIFSYFAVGAWQLTSFFTYFKKRKQWNSFRKAYGIALIILAIALIPPLTFFGLFGLLFLSPIMAIWYWFMTKHELGN